MSRTIFRPGDDVLPPGVYTGELVSVERSEYPSDYHDSGKREALDMKYRLSDGDGNAGTVMDYPTLSFDHRSNLHKTLKGLNALPDRGEGLDLDELEGTRVRAVVEVEQKRGGGEYNKIVQVSELEEEEESGEESRLGLD